MIHGLGEHSGRYEGLARAMAAQGIGVHAVDWRGHGKAGGARGHVMSWTELLQDAQAFVEHVAGKAAGGEVIPLGHSVGGAILASAVVRGSLRPERFALSSPAFRIKARVPGWKVKLGQFASKAMPGLALDNELDLDGLSRDPAVATAYRTDPLTHSKISARLYTEWLAANAESLRRAAEVETPFFAGHGGADPVIDRAGTEEFFNRASAHGKVLKIYEGFLHEPYNDTGAEQVFADLADWIKYGRGL